MAILWDAPLASAVASELSETLAGARLRALFLDQPARNLVLFFREGTLVFRLHPLRGEVTLHPATDDFPQRSRPLQAHLRRVHAPADERLLLFRFAPVRSGREPMEIAVELLPNRWNAVVLEARSRTIRHVLLPDEGAARGGGKPGSRRLLSGAPYEAPAPSSREGADGELPLERWLDVLLPLEPDERRGALLRSFAHTASLNAPALLGVAGEDAAGGAPASPGEAEKTAAGGAPAPSEGGSAIREALVRGWELWKELAAGEPRPCLLETPKGLHPYPLPLPHLPSEPCASLLGAFEAAAAAEGVAPEAALIPSDLLERLEQGVRNAEKRVRQLERELERAPDPEPIRAIGDLILARFGEIPKGRDRVELTGFDGERVEVELDPALAPHENAARYYDEAARAVRARETVPRLIRSASERAEALERLMERAWGTAVKPVAPRADERVEADECQSRGGAPAPLDLAELARQVDALVPRRRKQGRSGKGPDGGDEPLPYHVFRSSGGLEIRVGRGARANDALTFHHSNPDDIWLHARQVGGAHVILRWSSQDNPPARDLHEAGVLAALNSKARTSGSVPVDWTRRKHVRKPRKSPPGAVLPTRVSTIFVEPDPELAKRLAER